MNSHLFKERSPTTFKFLNSFVFKTKDISDVYELKDDYDDIKKMRIQLANYMSKLDRPIEMRSKTKIDNIAIKLASGLNLTFIEEKKIQKYLNQIGVDIDVSMIKRMSPFQIEKVLLTGYHYPLFSFEDYLKIPNLIKFVVDMREMEKDASNLVSLNYLHQWTSSKEKFKKYLSNPYLVKERFNSFNTTKRVMEDFPRVLESKMMEYLSSESSERFRASSKKAEARRTDIKMNKFPGKKLADIIERYGEKNILSLDLGKNADNTWLNIVPKMENLRTLNLGSYVGMFYSLAFPKSLKNLIFGNNFNRYIHPHELPNGILSITFGYNFVQSLEGSLPNGLQSLSLGTNYPYALLKKGVIPETVRNLVFDGTIQIDKISFPSNLETLTMVDLGIQPLKDSYDYLPKSLKTLIFKRGGFEFLDKIPEGIETLDFGGWQSYGHQLPKSLKTIIVSKDFTFRDGRIRSGVQVIRK